MATLTNTKIKDTYDGLLKTTDNDVIGASEKNITDGLGNASVLSIGTASASFSSDIEVNTLTIGKGANDVSTNTALGYQTLENATGAGNTAVGYASLLDDTTGVNNTAVGSNSLRYNTTGGNNTAIGIHSLAENTTASNNTAIGSYALADNTTGGSNVAVGQDTLSANTTGSNITAVGRGSMSNATAGDNNTALGFYSLVDNQASNNVAVGDLALRYNTTGSNNTAIGHGALDANTTGQKNVAVGSQALSTQTIGSFSTALGFEALMSQTTGSNNTAVGYASMRTSTTGTYNTAIGVASLYDNTTGSNNVAIGRYALTNSISGDSNIGIGTNSGNQLTTGSNNIYIGGNAEGSAATNDNEIVIGYNATGNGSNTATYGDSNITHHYFTSGTVRIDSDSLQLVGATNPTILVQDSTSGVEVGLKALETSTKIDSTHTFNIEIGSGNDIIQSVTSSGVEITGNLAVDTNTLYVDAASNEVGVGTSNPDGKMHILNGSAGTVTANGNADELVVENSATGGISILTPDSSTGYLMFGSPTDNEGAIIRYNQSGGLLTIGTEIAGGQLTFRTAAGSERMRIDSSGNVGIGADPSSYKLRVREDQAADTIIRAENQSSSASAYSTLHLSSFGNTWGIRNGSSAANGNSLVFVNDAGGNNFERMRIDSSGNVGIGTQSASAGAIGGKVLHLVNSGATASIRVDRSDASTSGTLSVLSGNTTNGIFSTGSKDLTISTNSTEAMRIDSSGNVSQAGTLTVKNTITDSSGLKIWQDTGDTSKIFNHYNGSLLFGTNNTERMRIDSSGDIGIGTTDGDIFGRFYARTVGIKTTSGIAKLQIDGSSYSGIDLGKAGVRYSEINCSNTQLGIQTIANIPIIFGTGTSATERMRITSGGDVLIGTQTSIGANENTNTGITLDASNFIANARNSVSSNMYLSKHTGFAGSMITFSVGGTEVGSITTTTSSTAYNTSSDYRLKENVVEMTGALDRVDALKPSRFNFIADPEKTVDGFIAHEVAEVVPEAVTGEKDAVDEEGNPIYQGIDQSKIVPLLVGAIKELRAEIELLKSQING
jgi:hypothetical protein